MKKIIIFEILAVFFITFYAYGSTVPDTQQVKCYDDSIQLTNCPQPNETFFGQDAQYNSTSQSYIKLGARGQKLTNSSASWIMVRDNVTGLTWEVKNSKDGTKDYSNFQDADNTYTWYDSNTSSNGGDAGTPGDNTDTEDFIKNLNAVKFGGFSDWRMPTARELSFIFNRATETPPENNTSHFPNTIDHYWSSTTDPSTGHPERAASIDFSTGWMNFPDKFDYAHVRAVRGEKMSRNFIDNGDGTVTDTVTGLMWQQDGSSKITWGDALSYCENRTLADYDDWRMPNINELMTLADYSKDLPSIDTSFFPMTFIYYWSSTTCAYCTDEAFQVCFGVRGRLETKNKHDLVRSYVRAVRGGLNGTAGGDNGTTCPAAFLLGDKDPGLNKIRKFRDEVLAKTAIGQKLIDHYNKNSARITDVLEQNPMMQKFARETLKVLSPVIDFFI